MIKFNWPIIYNVLKMSSSLHSKLMKFRRIADPPPSDGTLQYSTSTVAWQPPSSSTNLFNISESELKASLESIKPRKIAISKKKLMAGTPNLLKNPMRIVIPQQIMWELSRGSLKTILNISEKFIENGKTPRGFVKRKKLGFAGNCPMEEDMTATTLEPVSSL